MSAGRTNEIERKEIGGKKEKCDESLERFYLVKGRIIKISEELTKINNKLEITGGHARHVGKYLTDTHFVEHREKIG